MPKQNTGTAATATAESFLIILPYKISVYCIRIRTQIRIYGKYGLSPRAYRTSFLSSNTNTVLPSSAVLKLDDIDPAGRILEHISQAARAAENQLFQYCPTSAVRAIVDL